MPPLDRESVLQSLRDAKEQRARKRRRDENPPKDAEEAERRALEGIVEEKLSSVEFVMDYAQLHFDGPTLTTVTMPHVLANGAVYQPEVPGYRDALCERIGARVVSAIVRPHDAIEIAFADGAVVTVSLRQEDRRAPDAAWFDAEPGDTWIW